MTIIGLDPGPTQSAYVVWDGEKILTAYEDTNEFVLERLATDYKFIETKHILVIEKIESYGMAVGAEVFETCYWSGIFAQSFGLSKTARLGRGAIKLHICGSKRANDSNVRQAILDRFGGKEVAFGKKAAPGPLYGITGHRMSAFAVALTYYDQLTSGNSADKI